MGLRLLLVLGSVLYIASLASATSLGKTFNVCLAQTVHYATGYYCIGFIAAAKSFPGNFLDKKKGLQKK